MTETINASIVNIVRSKSTRVKVKSYVENGSD